MNSAQRFDYEMSLCNNLGWTKAGRILNKKPNTLQRQVHKVYPDFKPRIDSSRKWFAQDIAGVFELLSAGLSCAEIATTLGVAETTLKTMLVDARKNGFDVFPMNQAKAAT